ncbi:hypothetical protein BHE74_00033338 [Ensete ventricosum]|nr:hypothetical protein BHE74_00033338 [Ensete ventricosum]
MGGIFRSVKLQAVRQKSIVGGRLREKSIADGRLREKSTCPRAIAAHGSQALFLPHREKDRGDYPYKYRDELDIPVRISKSNLGLMKVEPKLSSSSSNP